jgi:hypothetical protein
MRAQRLVLLAGAVLSAALVAGTWLVLLGDLETQVAYAQNEVTITAAPAQEVEAGGTTVFVHQVTNNISPVASMTFTVTLEDSAGFVSSVSTDTFTLTKNTSTTITVTVTAPPGTAAGTVNETTVTVHPENLSFDPASTIDTTTVVGLTIEPAADAKEGAPGASVSYVHTLENGTAGQVTVDVGLANSDPQFGALASASQLALDAGATEPLTVTVSIPAGAAAFAVNTTTVTVTPQSGPGPVSALDVTTVILETGVTITPDNEEDADPGETVVFDHTITNTGNQEATFSVVAVSGRGWQATPSVSQVILAKDAFTNITVSVEVPKTACALDDVTTVTVTKISAGGQPASDSATNTIHVSDCLTFLPMVSKPRTWAPVGTGWNSNDQASSLAVCPTDDSVIFAGTDTGKVLRYNAGVWQQQSLPGLPSGSDVRAMVIDHSNCETVYAGVYHSSSGGVWKGTFSGGGWDWIRLGTSVASGPLIRGLAFADGVLFAGNEQTANNNKSLVYWNGSAWVTVLQNLIVMDLVPANPVAQTGRLYAAIWLQEKIRFNNTPGVTPGTWSELATLADLPAPRNILTLYGDATTVRQIGMRDQHYRQVSNNWQLVANRRTRTFANDGSILYVGYDLGHGVGASFDGGVTFHPMNDGFGAVPTTIFRLVQDNDEIFAATSSGVWRRVQGQ